MKTDGKIYTRCLFFAWVYNGMYMMYTVQFVYRFTAVSHKTRSSDIYGQHLDLLIYELNNLLIRQWEPADVSWVTLSAYVWYTLFVKQYPLLYKTVLFCKIGDLINRQCSSISGYASMQSKLRAILFCLLFYKLISHCHQISPHH